MSLVLAVKVARVSPLFNELQLVRRLLTIWMSQIVMSNADKTDKMDAGKKSNNLPVTGATCTRNRCFGDTFSASCTRNDDFMDMTHASGAQR